MKNKQYSLAPWSLALVLGLGIALSGCATGTVSNGDSERTASQSAPESEAAEEESEIDKDCLSAFSTVGLVEAGLRLQAEQAPLTEEVVADIFSDTTPYADRLPDPVRADYQTYHDAALSAVGLEAGEVDAILDTDDVQSAIKSVSNKLVTSSACL
ncbi:hypothetical protein ESZ53_04300 [Salinibacterium sp. UTAS2018]|uniref:hypothetical protein n=1 Tax=Salinibacterium sp. UTAS2018 TaxID=2508880 RepID=UPI0010095EA8|nr:hypothetical protein [Salinibacterium sp. UTAS2018]QAV69727.1 hypothetical protein ESZ53_04300 [Salinibacterium sp. UTAS2018]